MPKYKLIKLRAFRKDNNQQLKEICEEINKTNGRMEKAENRIDQLKLRYKGERRTTLHQWWAILSVCCGRDWISRTPLSCELRGITMS